MIYHQYTTSVLPLYHYYTPGILPVYYQYTTSVLPLYHYYTPIIPLLYYQYIPSILLVCSHCTTIILPVYSPAAWGGSTYTHKHTHMHIFTHTHTCRFLHSSKTCPLMMTAFGLSGKRYALNTHIRPLSRMDLFPTNPLFMGGIASQAAFFLASAVCVCVCVCHYVIERWLLVCIYVCIWYDRVLMRGGWWSKTRASQWTTLCPSMLTPTG